jgi:hypothetical protein
MMARILGVGRPDIAWLLPDDGQDIDWFCCRSVAATFCTDAAGLFGSIREGANNRMASPDGVTR